MMEPPPLEPGFGPGPQLPSNVECEAMVIGGMMIANAMIPAVMERVTAEDFYEPLYGRIFDTIAKLHARGVGDGGINAVTLRPIFEHDKDMQDLGGPAYLAELSGNSAVLVGLLEFASQVSDLAARRRMIEAAQNAIDALMAPSADEETLEHQAAQLADQLSQASSRQGSVKPRTAEAMIRMARERAARDDAETFGATCKTISDFNKLFGPVEPGTLIYLAGRPGMGKTVVGISSGWGYASAGHPTEYFHWEMTPEQLAMRVASDIGFSMGLKINHSDLRAGRMQSRDLRALDEIGDKVAALPFRTFSMAGRSIAQLEARIAQSCSYWERKGRKLEMVFVDYMQLIDAYDDRGRRIENAVEKVNAVSRRLRRICDKYNVGMIALSQLSRAVESRPDKRPMMADLRDSGQLEQDADGVLLLYREEYYLKRSAPKKGEKGHNGKDLYEDWLIEFEACRGKIDLILGKWRHGEDRTRTAKFYGEHYAVRGGDHYPEDQMDDLL